MPDWRVPVSSPSPRSSRSISASANPSPFWARACRRLDSLGPKSRHSDACCAAADAPAQLVQLGDPVALGVLDEHHGGVGDVDADLDDRRRHEDVRLPRREALHRLGLLARAHLAVQQDDLEVLELRLAQPLELGRGRAGLQRLGLAHERADDERLAAGAQLLAQAVVGALALALARGDVRLDRLAAARQPAQRRDVQRAEAREAQRPGDRRRGHVQHVRGQPGRGLGVQRRALAHAEAVLLVDDGDREVGEHDGVLDERVRPDDERQLARRELAQRVGAPPGGGGAGEQRRGDERPGHERLQRREVLLGERLRRRHERRLAAVLDGAQHRVQRDDGLARARPPP